MCLLFLLPQLHCSDSPLHLRDSSRDLDYLHVDLTHPSPPPTPSIPRGIGSGRVGEWRSGVDGSGSGGGAGRPPSTGCRPSSTSRSSSSRPPTSTPRPGPPSPDCRSPGDCFRGGVRAGPGPLRPLGLQGLGRAVGVRLRLDDSHPDPSLAPDWTDPGGCRNVC